MRRRTLASRISSEMAVSVGRLDNQYSVGASAPSGHSISSRQSGRIPSHQPCSADAVALIGRSTALPAVRTYGGEAGT
ncbi:hypothetical protein SAVERM_732 [Streptomyces avermitilis MA-4680 = NBRC 14893]|uniref:Uncharacterized protein n=1 Tax=Streptomyces avermitilis (strain ATCC 31267 / DSM 46492 / JCM 5070 / NBRC 14893 / NCIMB 12804 / NRRL 8165 / MA-4680) TaxID=227882 RepID=Q82PY9_STRAW|nr:hypothetical protein SAVERM_732 [Streptomyces avermitilis MA-4680 = NBRC 14893]